MAFLRFLLVGGFGFLVDTGLTTGLIAFGWSPETARIPAIGCSMLCTWLANRMFTFRVAHRGSIGELSRYLAVALVAAGFNYLIYWFLLRQSMPPLPAIVVATAIQAGFSFLGYRQLVFNPSPGRSAGDGGPGGSEH